MKLDNWEEDLVQKYSIPVPTNDYDALNLYPELSWVYDKYKFLRWSNEPVRLQGLSKLDEIVKPRFNPEGLGLNVHQGTQVPIPSGYIACPKHEGPHYSVDWDGEGMKVYKGRKIANSFDFYLWHKVDDSQLDDKVIDVVYRLQALTGRHVNLECIGSHVIEGHLRPSIQFWADPEYSLVYHHDDSDLWKPEWIPSSVQDVGIDSNRVVINGNDLRMCYMVLLQMLGSE